MTFKERERERERKPFGKQALQRQRRHHEEVHNIFSAWILNFETTQNNRSQTCLNIRSLCYFIFVSKWIEDPVVDLVFVILATTHWLECNSWRCLANVYGFLNQDDSQHPREFSRKPRQLIRCWWSRSQESFCNKVMALSREYDRR